jgi:hypothetical protein
MRRAADTKKKHNRWPSFFIFDITKQHITFITASGITFHSACRSSAASLRVCSPWRCFRRSLLEGEGKSNISCYLGRRKVDPPVTN